MLKRILLDVDDVLCDCTGAAMRHMGVHDWQREDHNNFHERNIYEMYYRKTGIHFTGAQFWEHFKREFWANIPPNPWCLELIDLCVSYVGYDNVALCTSPTKCGDCLAGKLDWIENFMPAWIKRQYIMTPRKHFCASASTVLIDDSRENTEKFRESGGLPITFPQAWNQCRDRVGEEIQYVQGWLDYYWDGP